MIVETFFFIYIYSNNIFIKHIIMFVSVLTSPICML